jgi:monovalent cation:H+ antiporter-2, CPA2 family
MIIDYLYLLVAIFGVSGITIYVLGKMRVPSIVGFLVGGIIIGPSCLDLIKNRHEIEVLADIGVIMLMFTIGLEFSLKNLLKLRLQVLGGGLLQVAMTTATVAALSYFLLSEPPNGAIFSGILVSLSSTAIAFKLIAERGEMHTPHGRASIGMLIFQDLCVVLYMLLIPVLAGKTSSPSEVALIILKAFLVVGIVLVAAKWGVPRLLHEIVKTRSRELFLITIIVLCLGTALGTFVLGLSLALGAFLAGVIISESEYSAQTLSDVLPLKESFSALFFISIGMLLNLVVLFNNMQTIIVAVLTIFAAKFITVAFPAYLTGQSPANSLRAGLYLAQIGEFSFVVAMAGKGAGLMTEGAYQVFLSAAVLTMMATPFLVSSSARVSSWLLTIPLFRRMELRRGRQQREHFPAHLTGHVIVVGFGVNGSNLAKALRYSEIPYAVLELNSETVRRAKRLGEPIYYGDGTSMTILRKLGVQSALAMVVAISDASATRSVVRVARTENPSIYIVARTRYVSEVDDLVKLGASEVIPEEFETSVEIFSKILHYYHVPINVIRDHIEVARADSYRALRTVHFPGKSMGAPYDDFLQNVDMETYQVKPGSRLHGLSLAELRLRTKTGVTAISVKRGEDIRGMPPPSFRLEEGDILILIGKRDDIACAADYLETGTIRIKTEQKETDET